MDSDGPTADGAEIPEEGPQENAKSAEQRHNFFSFLVFSCGSHPWLE